MCHHRLRSRWRARYKVAVLASCTAAIGYAQRAGLPIAVVRMQSQLGWDRMLQGQILAAFYLGYALMQIPSGWLATKYGARRVVGVGVLASSLLHILLPVAASSSVRLVTLVRVLQGVSQAGLFPAYQTLWSAWAPPTERSRLASFPQVGAYAGQVLCGSLAGAQADSTLPLIGGWPSIFYLWGGLGLGVAWLWGSQVYESPEMDPGCAAAEVAYLRRQAACSDGRGDGESYTTTGTTHVPATSALAATPAAASPCASQRRADGSCAIYAHILRSPPVWGITCAHVAADWAVNMMNDGLPPYLRDVRALELSSIGVALSLPGALKPLVTVLGATAADQLVSHGVRILHVRKFLTACGLLPMVIFMLLMACGWLQATPAILAGILVCVPLEGFTQGGGYAVNGLDIAPSVAGMVLAVWNTFGQLTGMAAPWLLGMLTPYPDGRSREQHRDAGLPSTAGWVQTLEAEWRMAFLVHSLITAAGCAAYMALATDVVQPWARPRDS